MRSTLLLATLAFACGGEQGKSVPAEPAPATTEPAPATTEPAPPTANTSDAGAEAPSDDCVPECVASRQMQATSPEQIQSDCEARCSGEPASAIDAPASAGKGQ